VPGIDFTDDPLLQGRTFSYLDTQLKRLGSPNWPELPINRSLAPVSNNQRQGHMRYRIEPGRVNYEPNTLQDNMPNQVSPAADGFVSYPESVAGPKVRQRSPTFGDHYGQARLFWNSMTRIEREHIARALEFELSKCGTRSVRLNMLTQLRQINEVLAAQVARALGESVPTSHPTAPPPGSADSAAETAVLATATSPTTASGKLQRTKGLSLVEGQPQTPKGRLVAILAADGVAADQVLALMQALTAAGAHGVVVGSHLGPLAPKVEATATLANSHDVLFDAFFVPGGPQSVKTLVPQGDARAWLAGAYKHAKPIGAVGEGVELVTAAGIGQFVRPKMPAGAPTGSGAAGTAAVQTLTEVGEVRSVLAANDQLAPNGIIVGPSGDLQGVVARFLSAVAHHRFWGRPNLQHVPA
jgi:catalase